MKKLLRFFRNAKPVRFVKNAWYFRRELTDFRWYDYIPTLNLLSRAVQNMADNVEVKGYEVDESRLKKVEKMRRLVQIIHNMQDINHIEMAEAELGELKPVQYLFKMSDNDLYEVIKDGENQDLLHNDRVYKRAREIEETEWEEFCDIIRGQDYSGYDPKKQDWNKWFDGTGLRGWWD